ncbi:MAG: hypothetical protein ACRD1B_00850 [Thermoanaerobaculia bacterium]
MALRKLSVLVNERGFFHFVGVPAGAFRLLATQEGYSAARADVDIIENVQAELREPLVMGRPRSLQVLLDPPLDPWGQRWWIKLGETSEEPNSVIEVVTSQAGVDGIWTQGMLGQGVYRLIVKDHFGSSCAFRDLDVDSASSPTRIDVPRIAVRGTVALGRKPLGAKLFFGGEHGAVSIVLESDEAGQFRGFLPRLGPWPLTVLSSDPPLKRNIERVQVIREAEESGDATVTIRLPNSTLTGDVIDGEGKPPEFAMVEVASADGSEPFLQMAADDAGRFRVEALPPGRTFVRARAAPDLLSDTAELTLDGEGEHSPVKLVLRRQLEIRGQLLSREGPVPGARVFPFPGEWSAFMAATPQTTDAEGKFRYRLPAGSREVLFVLFPPGFSLRVLRVAVPAEGLVTIPVEQLGGQLTVQWTPSDESSVYLRAGREMVPLDLVAQLWGRREQTDAGETRIVVPHIEAGLYAICRVKSSEWTALLRGFAGGTRCQSGVLSQLGDLTLKLPAAAN